MEKLNKGLRNALYLVLTCVKQLVMIKAFWRLVSIMDLMAAGYFIVTENIYGLVSAMGFAIIAQNISNAR
jgi:hypothetical protein